MTLALGHQAGLPAGFIGHPAYVPDALRADLDRFSFLLGEDPCLPVPGQGLPIRLVADIALPAVLAG
ncbi:MAG: hypothetical protein ABSA02_21860 [Trebonia sp.]